MDKLQPLSDSELEIMRAIWAKNGSALFAEILEDMNKQNRNWKPNTILTFLARLISKGYITTRKHGRINEYIVQITLQDYTVEQTKTFVNNVFGGNAKNLVSALLKHDYISPSDMAELKEFWERSSITDE